MRSQLATPTAQRLSLCERARFWFRNAALKWWRVAVQLLEAGMTPFRKTPGGTGAVQQHFPFHTIAPSPGEPKRASRDRVERVLQLTRRFESITQQVSLVMSLEAMAEAALAGAREAVLADTTALYLLDDNGQHLNLLRAEGMPPSAAVEYARVPLTIDAPITHAVRLGTAIWTEGREDLAQRFPAFERELRAIEGAGDSSFACIPMVLDGRAWGVVAFCFRGPRRLHKEERKFLSLLADHCALALARARSFERLRVVAAELRKANRTLEHARRQAQATADYLSRLQTVTAAFASASTVDEVAGAVMREGVAAFGACQACFALPQDDATLRIIAQTGCELASPLIARDAPTPLCVAFNTESVVVASDGEASAELCPEAAPSGVRAAICGPILHGGEVRGVFGFGFREARAFSDEDRNFVKDLANVTALALTRAQLFEAEKAARTLAEEALERARAADRRKDEFLAMLGHELRNPLAPIATALQLTRLRGEDPFAKEHAIIERQVRHLERLVDDLLDVSRITRGKVELRRAPVEIADLVAEAVDVAGPLFERKQQHVDVKTSPGLFVIGDRVRLCQVISNLLTNAAKYTDAGGHICVRAARVEDKVRISVSDDGIGIDPDLLPHVFEMFAQSRQTIARSQGGLGLGLTIVKQLVELHGGSVSAHSEGVGKGSEFVVSLPVGAPARETSTSKTHDRGLKDSAARPKGHRILVVDDNEDAASLLGDALTRLGHEVRITTDGPSALEQARIFQPEIVCLDIGLPVMDGYEVAQRLREEHPGPMRLIAITGYGLEHDREKAERSGFDLLLVKPVDFEALAAACRA
jgi:signal transduction histidine kinase